MPYLEASAAHAREKDTSRHFDRLARFEALRLKSSGFIVDVGQTIRFAFRGDMGRRCENRYADGRHHAAFMGDT